MLFLLLIIAVWISIDNFKIKRKITRLISKIEQLSKIANVECDLPIDELSDEIKINCLENQLDSLEPLILSQNCQDKDQKNTQQQ